MSTLAVPLLLALDHPLGRLRRSRRRPVICFAKQPAFSLLLFAVLLSVLLLLFCGPIFPAYTFRLLPPARTYTPTTAVSGIQYGGWSTFVCVHHSQSAVCVSGGRLRC